MYTYLLFCNAAQVAREHERIHQHPPLKKFQLFRPVMKRENTMRFWGVGGRERRERERDGETQTGNGSNDRILFVPWYHNLNEAIASYSLNTRCTRPPHIAYSDATRNDIAN